jgi:hypothetical protein
VEPEPSWSWPARHELAPGLLAWALLGDGRRCETWPAWDLGRWCPVAVKLPRPGPGTARAAAALTREAQVAESTAHPGIRRLLESRLDQPLPHPSSRTSRGRPWTTPWPATGRSTRPTCCRHAAGRRPRPPARPRPGPPERQAGQRGAARRPAGADRPRPGPAGRRGPSWPARRPPPAAATPRCRPPSTGPSPPCWPPTRRTVRPPPPRCWPCWPGPCRPTPPRRTGCGPPGPPGASPAGKSPPWRVPRWLHDLRRHCRWHTDAPCQNGCHREDCGSPPGTGPGAALVGARGAAGGCARSPGAGLPRGRRTPQAPAGG